MSAAAVYEAEQLWSAVLDRGGPVEFHGSHLHLPVQKRFADIASVQRYVDDVLARESTRTEFPNAGPVTVRERRGQTRAHYEPATATIAVPLLDRSFGRESVVLHELAHHLSVSNGRSADRTGTRWHGVEFRETLLGLVSEVLGAQAALLLRAGYHSSGVRR